MAGIREGSMPRACRVQNAAFGTVKQVVQEFTSAFRREMERTEMPSGRYHFVCF